jgi:hypothetical protein
MIKNADDVKNWFLRNTYNTKTIRYDKLTSQIYYIGAILSDEIKNKILQYNGNNTLEYLGAVLAISENSYTIYVYLGGKAEYNGYLVGYLQANLNNVTLDWQKYINSKDFIKIDVPVENIIVTETITQGFKNKKIFTNTRALINNSNSYAYTDLLFKKYRVRNIDYIFDSKGYLAEPSYFKYFYLSKTPSICILANLIYKSIKSCDSKNSGKCLEKNNECKNNHKC